MAACLAYADALEARLQTALADISNLRQSLSRKVDAAHTHDTALVPSRIPKRAAKKREEGPAARLWQKERDKDKRIEALRAAKEAEELQTLQAVPRINETSRRLAARATGGRTMADRMEDAAAARAAKARALREALDAKELEEVKAKPAINTTSKRMQRGVSSMLQWQQEREKKLAAKRAAKEQAELDAMRPAPSITKKSERMVRRRRAGSVERAEDVGSRLYAKGHEYNARRAQKVKESQKEYPHKPTLSAHSATYVREGDAGDRLHALGKKRNEALRRQRLAKELTESRFDKDGNELFVPKINKRSKALAAKSRKAHPPPPPATTRKRSPVRAPLQGRYRATPPPISVAQSSQPRLRRAASPVRTPPSMVSASSPASDAVADTIAEAARFLQQQRASAEVPAPGTPEAEAWLEEAGRSFLAQWKQRPTM